MSHFEKHFGPAAEQNRGNKGKQKKRKQKKAKQRTCGGAKQRKQDGMRNNFSEYFCKKEMVVSENLFRMPSCFRCFVHRFLLSVHRSLLSFSMVTLEVQYRRQCVCVCVCVMLRVSCYMYIYICYIYIYIVFVCERV